MSTVTEESSPKVKRLTGAALKSHQLRQAKLRAEPTPFYDATVASQRFDPLAVQS